MPLQYRSNSGAIQRAYLRSIEGQVLDDVSNATLMLLFHDGSNLQDQLQGCACLRLLARAHVVPANGVTSRYIGDYNLGTL
jgi:hypothetical protein